MQLNHCRFVALAAVIASGCATSAVHAAKPGASQPPRAVATFESIGVYWSPGTNPGAAGCQIQYRKQGDTAWNPGLAMWYDARNSECRGSLVQLTPGTSYEIQVAVPGQPFLQLSATTWADTAVWPIADTVAVPSGTQTLNITQGGTPGKYVLYQPASDALIDAG